MLEMFKIKMVMIDECGDEVVINTFSVSSELDSDYLEVWESMKIGKARERYPEAMGFYFEDSRDLDSMVAEDVYSEVNGLKDARDNDEDIDEWDEIENDGNMPCDYSGFCAGASCPMYWKCQH